MKQNIELCFQIHNLFFIAFLDFILRRPVLSVRKVIGYLFLGSGTVFVVVAVFLFFIAIGPVTQFPLIAQDLNPVALAACVPYLILAAITYVIGGLSYCMKSVNSDTPLVAPRKIQLPSSKMLGKLKRLKGFDETYSDVYIRIPDDLTEKQYSVTQSPLTHAKKRIKGR